MCLPHLPLPQEQRSSCTRGLKMPVQGKVLLQTYTTPSTALSISMTNLPVKRYYWVEIFTKVTATLIPQLRFNNDSGSNYAYRSSANGAGDTTTTSAGQINLQATQPGNGHLLLFVINITAQEKIVFSNHIDCNTAGSGNAPIRDEAVGKWANTSVQINEIDLIASTSTFAAGTIINIWGAC